MMRVLDAATTSAALPYAQLTSAIRRVLEASRAGRAFAPERTSIPIGNGVLLTMPATDGEYASVKIVTAHDDNTKHGLPNVLGEMILMRADNGERLLMLDGATVTAKRTAAVSLLAAQSLCATPSGTLLIVGSGVQAKSHLQAFCENLEIANVQIYSRTTAHAETLVRWANEHGYNATLVKSALEASQHADLIVTATTATIPVIHGRLKPSAFIAAVGAFKPGMIEVPTSATNAARIVVDTLAGARFEAGDLLQAGVDWTQLRGLESAILEPPQRGLTLFKSVGYALWDLAAARLAWEGLT